MVILRPVRRSHLGSRDGTAQKRGIHLVRAGRRALIKRQDNERPGDVEVGVREERRQPVPCPFSRGCHRGIVAVVGWETGSVTAEKC